MTPAPEERVPRERVRMTPALTRKARDARVGEVIRHRGRIYRVVECAGEAHRNLYIDNCLDCAPLWGRYLEQIGGVR